MCALPKWGLWVSIRSLSVLNGTVVTNISDATVRFVILRQPPGLPQSRSSRTAIFLSSPTMKLQISSPILPAFELKNLWTLSPMIICVRVYVTCATICLYHYYFFSLCVFQSIFYVLYFGYAINIYIYINNYEECNVTSLTIPKCTVL